MRPWIGKPATTSSIISAVSGDAMTVCVIMFFQAVKAMVLGCTQG
jgi:hypothetical protein